MKLFTLIILCLWTYTGLAQAESWYIERIGGLMKAATEVKVYGGRAGVVSDAYAVEVEFVSKWKQAIGQSLWYAQQLNKHAGIVLVMKSRADWKYGQMLQSTIDYAGMTDQIKVWFYPTDFGLSFSGVQESYVTYKQDLISTLGHHTLNAKSGVRHNSKCRYFNCKNCVRCGPQEGKACGGCGG